MSQAASIRQGLADAVTAGGFNLGQVSPYELADPSPPCVFVAPGPITYDTAMHRGLDEHSYRVIALVPFTSDIAAQQTLDDLRDPSQMKAAIEADTTLGGACGDLRVTQASQPTLYERPGGPAALGCEWVVQIFAVG